MGKNQFSQYTQAGKGSASRKNNRASVKNASATIVKPGADGAKYTVIANKPNSTLNALGIELNRDTARQAIILSEIIGKPVSKRGGQHVRGWRK